MVMLYRFRRSQVAQVQSSNWCAKQRDKRRISFAQLISELLLSCLGIPLKPISIPF